MPSTVLGPKDRMVNEGLGFMKFEVKQNSRFCEVGTFVAELLTLQAEPVRTVGEVGEWLACDGGQAAVGCPVHPGTWVVPRD